MGDDDREIGDLPRVQRRRSDGTIVVYLNSLDDVIDPANVVVHNHVRSMRDLVEDGAEGFREPGENGFRAWEQAPTGEIEPCPCGWTPFGTHYRVKRAAE